MNLSNPDDYRQLTFDAFQSGRHIWADWIGANMKKCKDWKTCYSLKQQLTRETGSFLFAMDMFNLLAGMGFETAVIDGRLQAKASLRKG